MNAPNFRQRELDRRIVVEIRKRKRCAMCVSARAVRCFGPCALRDVADQMRNASQEREEVENA